MLVLAATTLAHAVDYPAQAGNVYDGAAMLPDGAETALEQKLLDFESATSIGIAVATVPSLQGLSPVDYANELGERWAIGSATSNNGVLLLVAKQERQLALRFGPGYDKRWGARTSQRIRDDVMVPQLKAGHPDLAIARGVDEVIREVTAAGYVNKWATGAAGSIDKSADADTNGTSQGGEQATEFPAPDNPLADVQADKVRREWNSGFMRTLGVGLLIGILVVAFTRARLLGKRRRELQTEIDTLTESLTHKLEQLPAWEGQLRGGYPEAMWGPALSAIDANALERLMYTGAQGRGNAELESQRNELRIANGALERVQQVLRRGEHGRTDSARQLRELSPQLNALRSALQNPDVLPETAALLEPLEVRQNELQALQPQDANAVFDWAAFADATDKLVADAAGLQARADSDVAQVRQAREQLPQLLASTQSRLAELRARNAGRYSDVDGNLDEMERVLTGYNNYGGNYNYNSIDARELMYMWTALQNALQHAQVAETSYVTHTTPRSSGSSFRSGSGGSSSWGGGGGGGSSFKGGSGGSSSW